jgi:hypothetical protein
MKERHTATYVKFNATLSEDLLRNWAEMISQWDQDKSKLNPYTHIEKGNIYYFTTFTLSC